MRETIEAIAASPALELAGVVLVGDGGAMVGKARALRRRLKRFGLAGAVREVVHRKYYPPRPEPGQGAQSQDGAQYCRENGIAWERCSKTNSPETAAALGRLKAPMVAALGAGILRKTLLDAPGLTFINAHAGKLPDFGGMHVCEWAVFQDHPVIGTVHRIEAGIDTGAILWERPLRVAHADTIQTLRAQAFGQVWEMVPLALEGLARGDLDFIPQPAGRTVKQWFRMHPDLQVQVKAKLQDGRFRAIQLASLAAAEDR
jgi:methionyl-tRNA formyltransferase